MKRWLEVTEHVPLDDKLYLGYCEIYGMYAICKFIPCRGWCDQLNRRFNSITHWFEEPLELPFPILDSINGELAKKYGIFDEHGCKNEVD